MFIYAGIKPHGAGDTCSPGSKKKKKSIHIHTFLEELIKICLRLKNNKIMSYSNNILFLYFSQKI